MSESNPSLTAGSPETVAPMEDKKYRKLVLLMLFLVYMLNFVDRQIVSILAIPIKEDLGLTDSQLGLVGGIAFTLFYATLGIPVAWLADRRSRTWIVTGALTLWSGATAVCGLAQNFTQLFFARAAVGVGEAGGVAPSHSLISDYFPPEKRAGAMAFYSLGVPLGSAIGIVFGGVLASYVDWRIAFIVVGVVGVLYAPIFRAVVREPKRGQWDKTPLMKDQPSLKTTLKVILSKPAVLFSMLGSAGSAAVGYGMIFWMPSLLMRSFDVTLLEVSFLFGGMLFLGGGIGLFVGGYLGDRFGPKNRSAYLVIPAISVLAAAPFYVIGALATTLWATVVFFFIPVVLSLMYIAPQITSLQGTVPAQMRATTSAVNLLFTSLVGIGGGIWGLGRLSDYFRVEYGDASLQMGFLVIAGLCVFNAVIYFVGSKYLKRDWVE